MSELYINLNPADKRMSVRHLCRIQRLRHAIRNPRMSTKRQDLQDEVDRRALALKQNAIYVPETETGLRDLINELTASIRG